MAEEFDDDPEYVDDGFTTGVASPIKSEADIDDKHTKIIHDVLKKYPHLVKNKQNIKLKITKAGGSTATVKQTPATTVVAAKPTIAPPPQPPPAAAAPSAKRIDSKKMHALIALGAENMEGPWLCLRCGVNGRPISIPSYKGFRRHLIVTHKEKIDPRICEHCGFKVNKRQDLHYHCLMKHNIVPPHNVVFPKCDECQYIAPDVAALLKHRETHHKTKNLHHCIYCNKTFSNEILLYNHIRNNHKERACEDGVMDFDDEEILDDSYVPNNECSPSSSSGGANKIKILSNIELPVHTISTVPSQDINLEPSSEAEALSNVATGIATSLGVLDPSDELQYMDGEMHDADQLDEEKAEQADDVTVTQFITEDGSLSTLQLTSSEKADLVRQMENQEGVVMILNDDFDHNQELLVNNVNQQGIVVVYSQPGDGTKQETLSQDEEGADGNASSMDEDMDIESGNVSVEKKDGKDQENSEVDMEQSADHSSLDSTFEHSLDDEDYVEKAGDDGKEQELVDKQLSEEKVGENDKKSESGDKKAVQKIISEVEDDWSDFEDDTEEPLKLERVEVDNERKEKIVTRKDGGPSTQSAPKVAAKVEKTYKNSGKKAAETASRAPAATEQRSIRPTRNKPIESAKQAVKQVVKEKVETVDAIVESIPTEEDENVAESAEKKESKTDVKQLISADWGDDDF